MRTIIQISDFHIKQNDPLPTRHHVFVDMIKAIQQVVNQADDPILVYNGDIVDYKDIEKSAYTAMQSGEDLEKAWNCAMNKAFKNAQRYFDYLTKQLKIKKDRTIICCGNHDVSPKMGKKISIKCPKEKEEAKYFKNRFKFFSSFCENFTGEADAEQTQFKTISGINFLIINSNWIDKYIVEGDQKRSRPLCINCSSIADKIDIHQKELSNTKRKNKLMNVFVAHAPLSDYCEDARFMYPGDTSEKAVSEVNKFFGLKLFGDKHTDDKNYSEYIVGAPLNWSKITLGVHQFDNNNHYHHKTIQYANNKWNVFGSEEDINELLSLSEPYIKNRAKEYLFGNDNVIEFPDRIKRFDEIRSSENWGYLDSLLRASAVIKRSIPGEKDELIESSNVGGFINTLTGLVDDSTKTISITVKGESRLGKSVCMSILYMNMLNKYASGTFQYFPLYYDVEKAVSFIEQKNESENRDSEEVKQKLSNHFREFLDKGLSYAKRVNQSVCCIIDGLNMYRLYNENRIEDSIAELIEELNNDHCISHLIHCIDSNNNTALGIVPQEEKKASEYVVYFDPILTNVVGENRRFTEFVHSFARLKSASDKDEKIVTDNIKKLGIYQVDTNLLTHFWPDLAKQNTDSYYMLIKRFVGNFFSSPKALRKAASSCYDYTVNGTTYLSSFASDNDTMANKEFDFIRTQRMVINYLLAVNYVCKIDLFADKDISCKDIACIDRLYGHDVCFFIREDIKAKKLDAKLLTFAEKHSTKLSVKGLSTLAYLIGRVNLAYDGEQRRRAKWFDTADSIVKQNAKSRDFLSSVAERSIQLSRLKARDTSNTISDYVQTLIWDSYERKVNRMFYLQFYGDRMKPNGESINTAKGFDIFNTYQVLASRLLKLKKVQDWTDLHELELFTLCDMVLTRIDNFNDSIQFSDDLIQAPVTCVESFFYKKEYNMPKDDLAKKALRYVLKIIDVYLSLFKAKRNSPFYRYLLMCKNSFITTEKKIMNGPLGHDDAFVSSKVLEEISDIRKVKRVGWNFESSLDPNTKLSKKEIAELQEFKDVHETTLEHTFEAFIIGLIYLPDSSQNVDYDKQTILNLLLIHDLGEVSVGDLLRNYDGYEKLRTQEDDYCRQLYLYSAHDRISNLKAYYELWDKWSDENGNDYNVCVAKDIDIIQRLYKMLVLLHSEEINLSNKRVQDFWEDRTGIKTNEGKKLFNVLLTSSPDYLDIIKEYNLDDARLS